MENLNKLVTLIELSSNPTKILDDNLELWKEFYDNREIIVRKNIKNEKDNRKNLNKNFRLSFMFYLLSEYLQKLHFNFHIIFFVVFNNHAVIHIDSFRKSNHNMHHVIMYRKGSQMPNSYI